MDQSSPTPWTAEGNAGGKWRGAGFLLLEEEGARGAAPWLLGAPAPGEPGQRPLQGVEACALEEEEEGACAHRLKEKRGRNGCGG